MWVLVGSEGKSVLVCGVCVEGFRCCEVGGIWDCL